VNVNAHKTIDSQIDKARNDIRTDKLDISFGELANLYESEELRVSPEYQRLFRWSSIQRSRFIESILLGFPTPAIFVAEDDKGVWELVDGLQRVSTVLEFLGVLKDAEGEPVQASQLVDPGKRSKLPSIGGVSFAQLSLRTQLTLKRAGCRVEVIKTGSETKMKYEVFERLNTGGSTLTAQEVRNCVFRSTAPDFVDWLETLTQHPSYSSNLGLSDFQEKTRFDAGLVLRYFTMKNAYDEFEHDVEPFITEYVRDIIEKKRPFNRAQEEKIFRKTHDLIGSTMGEEAWRHYRNGKHTGPLSVYVFETVAVGIALNVDALSKLTPEKLRDKIISFKVSKEFSANTGAGANSKARLLARLNFAKSHFATKASPRNASRTSRTRG
jgi:hypothetical protein